MSRPSRRAYLIYTFGTSEISCRVYLIHILGPLQKTDYISAQDGLYIRIKTHRNYPAHGISATSSGATFKRPRPKHGLFAISKRPLNVHVFFMFGMFLSLNKIFF